ncbi:MAG: GatB/YqeY domain-containing protein [Alphaproteobacteria bacterium]|nr:GatB/YqeY domain-containing protein [Alphaproteobacteria bacterium]MBF0129415.1 GatB/YqeY domain-containing protein [Alphaproteobacteria bacterium]
MLRSQLNDALKKAMLSRDTRAVSTVRLILAALKDRDIAARAKGNMEGVEDSEILQMFYQMVKQRRDSIALYEQGGRLDLAQQEAEEIVVIERFLPRQLHEDEIAEAVVATISDLDASGLKDMGRVMAALRERYAGQMDFGKAGIMVKARLSG